MIYMDTVAIIVFIVIIVIVIVARIIEKIAKGKKIEELNTDSQKYNYKLKYYFFTKNELYFYRDLIKATQNLNVVIFAKPRLADIIEPQKGENWRADFNKIQSKHVDFLICEANQIRPKLVVELDDNSHDSEKRTLRDNFVDSALMSAGIQILHVRGISDLEEKIKTAIL